MNFDPNTGEPIKKPANTTTKTNGLAIAGFVLSLIGGFLLDIVGLILSIVGLNKAKECNSGKGLAIAGIIISIVKLVVLTILVIVCWGIIIAALGFVSEYQEYCTKPETVCSAPVNGLAECKYKDGSKTITVTCPADKINTKVTEPTTTKKDDKGEYKKYVLDDASGAQYLADRFYLRNNRLYAHLTSKLNYNYAYYDKFEGETAYVIVENVAKLWTVEFGQSEYYDVIFTDLNGNLYKLNNISDAKGTVKGPINFTKIDKVGEIKDAYSLLAFDSVDYLVINNKNQIVYGSLSDGIENIYYDKKNNRGENLLGTDVYKLEIAKTEKGSDGTSTIYFNVYENGKKQDDQVKAETEDDTELIVVPYCSIGSKVFIGRKCE